MSLISVDLHALATSGADYLASLYALNESNPGIVFLSYDASSADVLGTTATATKIADLSWQAFHEGGVYNKEDNSLYVSSNYVSLADNINVTVLSLDDYSVHSTQLSGLAMANGGSTYYPPGSDQTATPPMQVWCDQGDLEAYAKLLAVNVNTNESEPLIIGYNGRNFSSLNDMRQHPETGDLWFTDPEYGYHQKFRAEPKLPRHIYRFEPSTGIIQVLEDGFVQLNGIEFSPDYKTLYVSDTGAQEADLDLSRPATIYAYDIVDNKRIQNKRLFAFADSGIPDGVLMATYGLAVAMVYTSGTPKSLGVEGINALGREVCKDFGVDSDSRCSNSTFLGISSNQEAMAPDLRVKAAVRPPRHGGGASDSEEAVDSDEEWFD
ncbi:hypothetical protein PInf_002378 [Phytophthora infestans]|nr:hypothetical protein PInf_002122 [Phytophthora infestans]KAI9998044.1 hypothetical protein PInf_002378 [Phytophthora infestans]